MAGEAAKEGVSFCLRKMLLTWVKDDQPQMLEYNCESQIFRVEKGQVHEWKGYEFVSKDPVILAQTYSMNKIVHICMGDACTGKGGVCWKARGGLHLLSPCGAKAKVVKMKLKKDSKTTVYTCRRNKVDVVGCGKCARDFLPRQWKQHWKTSCGSERVEFHGMIVQDVGNKEETLVDSRKVITVDHINPLEPVTPRFRDSNLLAALTAVLGALLYPPIQFSTAKVVAPA
ncbi:hypothetical protein B0H19DRAFT_1060901 [Mycena capillaripes]|nr:hypothetical protein B0H19DRAFT_1060901 [Mycena capillaripes]